MNAGAPWGADPEQRRCWRGHWLGAVQDFTDGEIQRAAWLNPANRNPHFSFGELFCSYFDDLGFKEVGGYAGCVREGLLSEAEADAVAAFHAEADRYDSPTTDFDHATILRDPAWWRVMAAARDARQPLLALLDDEDERRTLTERSRYALQAASPTYSLPD